MSQNINIKLSQKITVDKNFIFHTKVLEKNQDEIIDFFEEEARTNNFLKLKYHSNVLPLNDNIIQNYSKSEILSLLDEQIF